MRRINLINLFLNHHLDDVRKRYGIEEVDLNALSNTQLIERALELSANIEKTIESIKRRVIYHSK